MNRRRSSVRAAVDPNRPATRRLAQRRARGGPRRRPGFAAPPENCGGREEVAGIDGTEILTHFPPENTYNSQLNTKSLVPGRDNFKEKIFLDEFICLFGIGDGGGGPKEENIEYGIRMADLEGAPQVKFGRADMFFKNLSNCS